LKDNDNWLSVGQAMVEAANPSRILETRKTAPGLRLIDKWAVLIGGGENHRMGLYDMVLVKDNHIAVAGGIPQAIAAVDAYLKQENLDVGVEVHM
jgi:nicotinate-nucleotide pyrophosphorylase (carboxylating)